MDALKVALANLRDATKPIDAGDRVILLDEIERLRIPEGYVLIPEKMFFDLMAGHNKAYLLSDCYRKIINSSKKNDENQT